MPQHTQPSSYRSSFQLKLFFIFTLLTALITMLFLSLYIYRVNHEHKRFLREQIHLEALHLAESIRIPLYAENRPALQQLAEVAARAPEMHAVEICTKDGRALAGIRLPALHPETDQILETVEVHTAPLSVSIESAFSESRDDKGALIGTIRMERGTGDLKLLVRRIALISSSIAATFWLAVTLLSYLVLRQVTLSFKALMRGIQAMKDGDFATRIDIVSDDEPGRAARAINSLAIILEQRNEENSRLLEERLDLERQMLHAQKLESLGVLAGGIAHDFNNILTSIVGNADLALMRINPDSRAIDNLHKIERAAARAADLAKQMLAYSGKGKFFVENLDMNRLLEEMLQMLEVSISKNVELRLNLTPNLPTVEADATQIQQIIMNLVINASEAIGDKSGIITIATGCMDCDKSYLKSHWFNENISEGLYVYLNITDTGSGMDKETLARIFEPFFTTKFMGRGLGMAAVQGIIRGHKGAINIYSETSKGSSFKVLLPASVKHVEISNPVSLPNEWRGEGKVLLVDDEETVRDIGKEMFQELGFTIITANDGYEAIELFKNTPDIAFVILDLTMPHMDGEQCFQELQRFRPDVKVFISSGFSEIEVSQKFVGKGMAGFIQKPYKLSMLIEAVK